MVPAFTDSLLLEAMEFSEPQSRRFVNCGEWIDATVVMNWKLAGACHDALPPPVFPLRRRRWRKQKTGNQRSNPTTQDIHGSVRMSANEKEHGS